MKAAAITLAEWKNSFFNKITVDQASLDLINKSELLKSDIRSYAASGNVGPAEFLTAPETTKFASYRVPVLSNGKLTLGYISIGADRIKNPEDLFNVLAHELGHFKAEDPGALIAKARAAALSGKNKQAYEAACNLTEGYAKYNEVKARNEVLAENQAKADAEKRPLSLAERILYDRWTEFGKEAADYKTVQSFEMMMSQDSAAKAEEVRNASAYALGESNRSNTTSTTKESYFLYCKNSAAQILGSSSAGTSPFAREELGNTYAADGSAINSIVQVTQKDGSRSIAFFDPYGSQMAADILNSSGNKISHTVFRKDGSYDITQYSDRYWDGDTMLDTAPYITKIEGFNADGKKTLIQFFGVDFVNGNGEIFQFKQQAFDPSTGKLLSESEKRNGWYAGTTVSDVNSAGQIVGRHVYDGSGRELTRYIYPSGSEMYEKIIYFSEDKSSVQQNWDAASLKHISTDFFNPKGEKTKTEIWSPAKNPSWANWIEREQFFSESHLISQNNYSSANQLASRQYFDAKEILTSTHNYDVDGQLTSSNHFNTQGQETQRNIYTFGSRTPDTTIDYANGVKTSQNNYRSGQLVTTNYYDTLGREIQRDVYTPGSTTPNSKIYFRGLQLPGDYIDIDRFNTAGVKTAQDKYMVLRSGGSVQISHVDYDAFGRPHGYREIGPTAPRSGIDPLNPGSNPFPLNQSPSCDGGSISWTQPDGTVVVQARRDPVIFNLERGSVQTVGLSNSTAYFDMENNGQKQHTGWLTAGEGMLVYDPTNSGAVEDDSDLVAGFDVLKGMDDNGDGMLNASDAAWDALKVWVDRDGTAQFKADALFTLDALGIASIDLNAKRTTRNSNGNTILDDSTFTWKDGTTGDVAGVDLAYERRLNPSDRMDAQALTQLNQLIGAIAGFAPPAGGQLDASAINDRYMYMPMLAVAH